MCDNTSACGCGKTSSSGGGVEAVLAAPFIVVGAAVAVTLAVWLARTLAPWLIAAGALIAAGWVTRAVIRARRWLRDRRPVVVPAPQPAPELTPQVQAALAEGLIGMPVPATPGCEENKSVHTSP